MKLHTLKREVEAINQYFEAMLQGKDVARPSVKNKEANQLLVQMEQLAALSHKNTKGVLEMLKESVKISELDVKSSFTAKQLEKIVAKLVQSSNANAAVIEETTASFNEMTHVIDQGAKIITELGHKAPVFIANNEKNVHHMEEVISMKENVLHHAMIMSEKIDELREMASKVDEMVNGVKMIADQTNLLALNASIEAARAGEQGRGFAVVAEEIRKLAEGTKEKLEHMQGFTETIRTATTTTVSSVENTRLSVGKMDEKMSEVQESFSTSAVGLNTALQEIIELGHVLEEISASAHEMSSTVSTIREESEKVSEIAEVVQEEAQVTLEQANYVKAIDTSFASHIKGLVAIVNKGMHPMTNENFLEVIDQAINAHTGWVQRLKNMVIQECIVPIQADGTKCEFGHYYQSLVVNHERIKAPWEAIHPIHIKLHKKADEVIQSLEIMQITQAKKHMEEAEKLSQEIISLLEQVKGEVGHLSKTNEPIFEPLK